MKFLLSRHLAQFVSIYDNGSLRSASEKLGISQPALSKSMKIFEDLLDVTLFDRTKGKLSPTPFADILRLKANIILKEAEITLREIEAIKGNFYKPLIASAGPIWLSEILPNVLPSLSRRFPHLKIELKSEHASIALPKLYSGDSDMYFGMLPSLEAYTGLFGVPILTLRHVIYARKGHPIHKYPLNVRIEKSANFPWAGFGLWDGDTSSPISKSLFGKGNIYPDCSYGIGSLLGLARLAQDTDHLLLAVDVIGDTLEDMNIIEVEGLPIGQEFESGMVCRSTLLNFDPVNFLLDELKSKYTSTKS